MDEFGLVWLSLVWFDEVDFLKCPRSASQLSFTHFFNYLSFLNYFFHLQVPGGAGGSEHL